MSTRVLRHESAVGHVTGRARYADEQHPPEGMLSLWPVTAPHAHARILGIDTARARAMPGVHAVLTARDVPGRNLIPLIQDDWPVLAEGEVRHVGEAVALVAAESARVAATHIRVSPTTHGLRRPVASETAPTHGAASRTAAEERLVAIE